MKDGAVDILVRHAAEPGRPPGDIAKILDGVAGDGDEGALDGVHLIQIFGEEQLVADKRVQREEQSGDAGCSQLRRLVQGFSIPRYLLGSAW